MYSERVLKYWLSSHGYDPVFARDGLARYVDALSNCVMLPLIVMPFARSTLNMYTPCHTNCG